MDVKKNSFLDYIKERWIRFMFYFVITVILGAGLLNPVKVENSLAYLINLPEKTSNVAKHPQCYFGGGHWVKSSVSYIDQCEGIPADMPLFTPTESCQCGEHSCWNGKRCVDELSS